MKKRILLIAISSIVSLMFIHSALAYTVFYNIDNRSAFTASNVTMLCLSSPQPKTPPDTYIPISGSLNSQSTWNNLGFPSCGPTTEGTIRYAGLSYTITINGFAQTKYCPTLKITTDNANVLYTFRTHQESPDKPQITACVASQSKG